MTSACLVITANERATANLHYPLGKFVEWERRDRGTLKQVVVPVRNPTTGQIKVPDPECVAVYIMVMAVGDTEKYRHLAQRHDGPTDQP